MQSPHSSTSDAPIKSPRSPVPYPPSPPLSRSSHDSNESLRALEFSDGPIVPRSRTTRSYSMSGFDFQRDLLPLTLSEPENLLPAGEEKTIGLVKGIALIVGLQIGSGIFSSPGIVVANAQSVGGSLLVWLASGVLGWTGASSFAELGSAIPLNGGAQAYLAYAYNPLVSYLFAWTAIVALKPGGNGIIALIFAEYVNRLIFHATTADTETGSLPEWSIKVTASLAIVCVTMICIWTRNLSTKAAVVFTVVKVASLFLVAVLGIVQLARGKASSSFRDNIFEDTSRSPSAYALALYSGLWAFDGWDQANYVAGEMKNAARDLPRAIHSSMIAVIILFFSANISYFIVLDKATVGRSNTVALDFGRTVLGPIGGSFFAFLVAFSCFGALNGSFFTSGRLIYVASKEGYLPALFGRLHPTRRTPLNAMLLQAGITILFISLGGGFRSLINFAVVASWAFYFLTVFGLIILRVKEPDLPRPYKAWTITPLIFCAVALFLLCMPVIAAPLQALAVLGFVLAGIPVYFLTRRPESTGASRISAALAPISRIYNRLRGGSPSRAGWVPVATEADENERVEMASRQAGSG